MAKFKVAYILIITLLGMLFLYKDSINVYWIQTYHTDSPIVAVERQIQHWLNPDETIIATQSDQVGIQDDTQGTQDIEEHHDLAEAVIDRDTETVAVTDVEAREGTARQPAPQSATQSVIDMTESTPQSSEVANDSDLTINESVDGEEQLVDKVEIPALELGSIAGLNAETEQFVGPTVPQLPWDVILESGDKIFFVGDSLMQGVAPRVRQILYKRDNIDGVDLSKQSTGLAYPNFYNWPKVVAETLQQDGGIKAIVVYLGPNDPWDFPIPGRKKYLKFKSPEWERAYRGRIRNILLSAQQYNLPVIWLGAPCMRKDKLHKDMVYLNTLYQSEVTRFNGHYIPTSGILGCSDAGYEAYAQTEKGNQKVRTNDGIHFTVTGQRLLADRIIAELIILPEVLPELLQIESEDEILSVQEDIEDEIASQKMHSTLQTELQISTLQSGQTDAQSLEETPIMVENPSNEVPLKGNPSKEVPLKENPLKVNQVPITKLLLID
ncbi:SGNH family hydrolase [Ignatzschineria larvae DSM 13226]|uniref:SGNH family hydrolase n=1 Tax=Ignatzschineria larvae DSM 13226 TaxID=1111732 RepID=A0ABZ3C4Q2_9GAMM|nr:SGNH family hydrolase [Ignatzschineria larvae]